ncbi:hypothetical protein U1Q18_032536 [Sarracenia purpurea var. burkii]
MEGEETNWSEHVEDLVHDGEVEKAISYLESVVSKIETLDSSQFEYLQLSSALFDLANLYSAKGFSLKADDARSRALIVREKFYQTPFPPSAKEFGKNCVAPSEALACDASLNDDDWEAIADCAPEELLPPQCFPEFSKLSLEKIIAPKRRGRGTFSYTTHDLYSDQQSGESIADSSQNEAVCLTEGDTQIQNLKYGTRHVLVLADFPPSTRTVDLEKMLEDFKGRGFVIRWVNDTVALAVFRTPTIAGEACNNIQCSFAVRVLDENDILLRSIRPRDLEPPHQRPETSTRAARRLIAQGMGIKLPSTNFGSRELRKQEEARRNRIVSRQNMKDDAWGDDDAN